jgi:ribosomal protein S13
MTKQKMHQLLEEAVRNARCQHRAAPRWLAVRDLFGVGSTSARYLCREFGLDPEAIVGMSCATRDVIRDIKDSE